MGDGVRRRASFAIIAFVSSSTVSSLLSSCSPGGSEADAAVTTPGTVKLLPLPEQPTTVPPPPTTTLAPPTPPPSIPEITEIPVAPPLVPLVAIGTESGDGAAAVQQRLLDLGFWVQSTKGDYGVSTRQAVMAFQKYNGLEPNESVDEATAAALNAMAVRAHGLTNTGTLVEVDKARQLLFIVQDGETLWTINVSTGSGIPFLERDKTQWGEWVRGDSQTPDGIFRTDREFEKGWREGDLGEIYRPKYFNGGIALHGAYQVPAVPASHGCVRLSTPAMDFLWSSGLVPLGTTVWVHSGR